MAMASNLEAVASDDGLQPNSRVRLQQRKH